MLERLPQCLCLRVKTSYSNSLLQKSIITIPSASQTVDSINFGAELTTLNFFGIVWSPNQIYGSKSRMGFLINLVFLRIDFWNDVWFWLMFSSYHCTTQYFDILFICSFRIPWALLYKIPTIFTNCLSIILLSASYFRLLFLQSRWLWHPSLSLLLMPFFYAG